MPGCMRGLRMSRAIMRRCLLNANLRRLMHTRKMTQKKITRIGTQMCHVSSLPSSSSTIPSALRFASFSSRERERMAILAMICKGGADYRYPYPL